MPTVVVNGEAREFPSGAAGHLIGWLRGSLGLTGTKPGCGEGECGACTVLVDGHPVLSCRVPLAEVAGSAITTIEGLGTNGHLHRIQTAMMEERVVPVRVLHSGDGAAGGSAARLGWRSRRRRRCGRVGAEPVPVRVLPAHQASRARRRRSGRDRPSGALRSGLGRARNDRSHAASDPPLGPLSGGGPRLRRRARLGTRLRVASFRGGPGRVGD